MDHPSRFVGIDVSKAHLDVAYLPDGTHLRLANDEAGRAALSRWERGRNNPLAPWERAGVRAIPLSHAESDPADRS